MNILYSNIDPEDLKVPSTLLSTDVAESCISIRCEGEQRRFFPCIKHDLASWRELKN